MRRGEGIFPENAGIAQNGIGADNIERLPKKIEGLAQAQGIMVNI